MRGLSRARWCWVCRIDNHADCDQHMNDSAVDALDFITVRCDCPCEGEVPEGGKLIALVKDLRQDKGGWEMRYEELYRKSRSRNESPLAATIQKFLDEWITDEGRLLNVSENRNWQRGLGELSKALHDYLPPIEEMEEEEEALI